MSPRRLLSGALALALVAAMASAAGDEGVDWVPTLREAFKRAKLRGAPILVWCVGDIDSAEKADHDTLRNPQVQKAMKGYLVVLANPVDDHGSQDGTIDGKPAKVCRLAPGITCSQHKNAWSEVYGSFADILADKSGMIKVPNHFVVDPDGKLIGTINSGTIAAGFDVVPPPQMVKGLQTILIKAGGPGLSDEQYDRFQKLLAAARTQLEGGRSSEAARTLRPIIEIPKNIEIVVAARELLHRVDKDATAAFARANAMLKDGKRLTALSALEKVAEDFPGTESAVMAAKAAEDFRASPEGKKILKEIAREKEGREKLAKAIEVAEAGGRDKDALRLLDAVAKAFEGLPSGDEAAAKAAAIRADPERMKVLRRDEDERKAKGALLLARGLKDGGKKDEARAKLEEIVKDYPETESAGEARRLLEELR